MKSRAACFPLSQLRTSTSAGRVRLKSRIGCNANARLYSHSKVGMMAKLNNHVTQMVVAGNDITTPFTGSNVVAKAVKS